MKSSVHDVIIIGGGISGSYLAFKLKEKFQDILIIEKSKVLEEGYALNLLDMELRIMDASI